MTQRSSVPLNCTLAKVRGSSIGPLFYPEMGPVSLHGQALTPTQLYTIDASCFGGPANWQGTRFRLDNVSDGGLTRLTDTAGSSVGSGSLHGVKQLAIDHWNRGMTTHADLMRQNKLPALPEETETEREWMEGSPTHLHMAIRPVMVKSAGQKASGLGVQVSDDGLILIPNALSDKVEGDRTFQIDTTGGNWRKARLVVRKRDVSILRADIDGRAFLPISPRDVAIGETVVVVAGVAWNGRITTAGIVATNHDLSVVDANVGARGKTVEAYEDLLLTNLPAAEEYLGAPVTNLDGELIGLALPQRDVSSSHGYVLPVKDLRSIVRDPPIPAQR